MSSLTVKNNEYNYWLPQEPGTTSDPPGLSQIQVPCENEVTPSLLVEHNNKNIFIYIQSTLLSWDVLNLFHREQIVYPTIIALDSILHSIWSTWAAARLWWGEWILLLGNDSQYSLLMKTVNVQLEKQEYLPTQQKKLASRREQKNQKWISNFLSVLTFTFNSKYA